MNTQPDFETLYTEFREPIHRYLVRMVGQSVADDLTQDVFLKVNRALPRFRGRSKLSTWVYRIATNTALDWLRGGAHQLQSHSESLADPVRERDRDLPDRDAAGRKPAGTDDVHVKVEMNECIREYVDDLPPSYRAVITLSEYHDLANQAIADILGISLDNVKIRLHRARAALKRELDTGCDLYSDEEGELSCDRKPGDR
jgi:RNA polymerase sigma-70 factor (ECF subfamily)